MKVWHLEQFNLIINYENVSVYQVLFCVCALLVKFCKS